MLITLFQPPHIPSYYLPTIYETLCSSIVSNFFQTNSSLRSFLYNVCFFLLDPLTSRYCFHHFLLQTHAQRDEEEEEELLCSNIARCLVLAHSSGNHAPGLALAAKLRGIPAYIVTPKNIPICKFENVKEV